VQLKDWKVSPDLFPVEASQDTIQLISTAIKAAVSAWGAHAAAMQSALQYIDIMCWAQQGQPELLHAHQTACIPVA
jgi:hypothetical protein